MGKVVAFLATQTILFAIAQNASVRQIASIGGETPKHILIGGHSPPPLPPLAELTNGLHAQREGRIRL